MFLVWMPSPACVSRNCDSTAHIKFIFETAMNDLAGKNPIDFGEIWKTNMADVGHFVTILGPHVNI